MPNPPSLWKTFLVFLAPLILSNALQSLFGTVSNALLGQMIGVDALAAVSVFFPVMFFLFAFVMGLSTGAVLELARGLLIIALWSSVPFGMAIVFSGAMRAGGVALAPMLLSIFAIVAIEIPSAVILGQTVGLDGSGPLTRSCSAPCSSCNSAITCWSGAAGRFDG